MRFRNDTFARGFASWGSLQGTIRHFSVKGGTLLNVTNGYENVIYLQSHQGPTSENHFSLGPTKTYILNKYNTRIGPRYVYAIDDDTYFKDCILNWYESFASVMVVNIYDSLSNSIFNFQRHISRFNHTKV